MAARLQLVIYTNLFSAKLSALGHELHNVVPSVLLWHCWLGDRNVVKKLTPALQPIHTDSPCGKMSFLFFSPFSFSLWGPCISDLKIS